MIKLPDWLPAVLVVTAEYDHCEEIFWNTSLEFFVGCNDVFAWGASDAESISSAEDASLFVQALRDAYDAAPNKYSYGHVLYVARKRRECPRNALMMGLKGPLEELFRACGPEENNEWD